jgi:hypothetical protein
MFFTRRSSLPITLATEPEKVYIKSDFEISNKAFAVSVGKDGCGDFAVLDDYIIFSLVPLCPL